MFISNAWKRRVAILITTILMALTILGKAVSVLRVVSPGRVPKAAGAELNLKQA